MNRVTLIGRVCGQPVYHFSEGGADITRFTIETGEPECIHHCLAYGPAAIDLHTHLGPGTLLTVCGELIYRGRAVAARPVVLVRGYSYLDTMVPSRSTVTPASVGCVPG